MLYLSLFISCREILFGNFDLSIILSITLCSFMTVKSYTAIRGENSAQCHCKMIHPFTFNEILIQLELSIFILYLPLHSAFTFRN